MPARGEVATVLVVEGDDRLRERAREILAGTGLRVRVANDCEGARSSLEDERPDLVLWDLRLPAGGGLEGIRELLGRDDGPGVIVTDAFPNVEDSVAAMRAGAAYYLAKPLQRPVLARALAAALGGGDWGARMPGVEDLEEAMDPVPELVGVSTCIANVKQLVRAAARTSVPVFVYGPTGTGKELVARAIHRLSARARGPFVPVNCGALPDGLAAAELFGAEKGAFTGADRPRRGLFRAAEGGTILLDELGEMEPDLQVALLRVLQEGAVRAVGADREVPVDVRVIAATNRDPSEGVAAGRLRADLFFRLSVLKVSLQPLAARPEDVAPLVRDFMARFRARYGGGPEGVEGPALEALRRYPWPGNVRELQNVVEMIYALGTAGETIGLADLPEEVRMANPEGAEPAVAPPDLAEDGETDLITIREAELLLIRRALEKAGGNKTRAAEMLGISRPCLYRRLKELGSDLARQGPCAPGAAPGVPPRGSPGAG